MFKRPSEQIISCPIVLMKNYKFQVDQIFIFQEELFLRSVPKLGSDGQHSTLAYLLPEEDSNHENPTLKSEDTMVHKKDTRCHIRWPKR